MYDIHILNKEDVTREEVGLKKYLYDCLRINLSCVTWKMAEQYYENLEKYIADRSAIIVGAFENNKLIGFQWAYEVEQPSGKRLHSSFVCIDEAYQGNGVASQMMDTLEEIALKRNIHAIEAMCSADNEMAVQYHKHNGFVVERYKMVKKL